MKKTLFSLLCIALAACSSTPPSDKDADPFAARDPLQGMNEAVFSFNLGADEYVVRPVARAYHHVPGWGREGVGNFLTNLNEPSNMVNGVLQLNPEVTFTSLWRFLLNTTFGMAGMRDFAGENGLKYQDQDFGKTLKSYGMTEGSYLVLPLAGPSTARGTAGKVVDWFTDPVGWFLTTPETIAQFAAEGISDRDDNASVIDQLYYQSIEPYSATRAAYLQHEAFQ